MSTIAVILISLLLVQELKLVREREHRNKNALALHIRCHRFGTVCLDLSLATYDRAGLRWLRSLFLHICEWNNLPSSSVPSDDQSELIKSKRPDIRAPKLTVEVLDRDALRHGYIFTAPYDALKQGARDNQYIPYQIGPHIYDNAGVRITGLCRPIWTEADE